MVSADSYFAVLDYTPRKVFADKCPVCGTVDLNLVFGYVCEVDPKFKSENFQPGCGTVTLEKAVGRNHKEHKERRETRMEK